MSYILGAIGFLLAITVVIAFHEFGHYWVAHKANIKILRFAVGFGKPIYRRLFGADKSEFVIGSIPLGGYVKMLDERETIVEPHEVHRAFNRQSLGVRALVVVAGPMANFVLAFLFYAAIFMVGFFEPRVIVGEMIPDSAAMNAGLQKGDEIYAIEEQPVQGVKQTTLAILDAALNSNRIAVSVVSTSGEHRHHILEIDNEALINETDAPIYEQLGILLMQPQFEAIIGEILPNSAAEYYGLMAKDRITHFNGTPIENWNQLSQQIRNHPDTPVELTVIRSGREIAVPFRADTEIRDDIVIGKAGIIAYRPSSSLEPYRVHIHYGIVDAVIEAAYKTWAMTALTFKFIAHMVSGTVSLSNISGPITIAEVAGVSFLAGIVNYLNLLALLSISIGALNLLPVPMLDGGHLMHYLWEFIRGKPLSLAAQLRVQWVGIAMISCLIVLALHNDIQRLLGS